MGVLNNILLEGENLWEWSEMFTSNFFSAPSFAELFAKFGFNLLFAFIVIRVIYYTKNRNREYLFTFFIFNVIIFFVTFLLSGVKLKIGFAFGLFAVFSILRYRTEAIPIKEMTFLFVSITIAVINALSSKVTGSELIFTNVAIATMTFVLEAIWMKFNHAYKMITYEKVDLIKPQNRAELIADLEERTGLDIIKVDISKIDYLRDTAVLKVYHVQEEL